MEDSGKLVLDDPARQQEPNSCRRFGRDPGGRGDAFFAVTGLLGNSHLYTTGNVLFSIQTWSSMADQKSESHSECD